MPSPAHAAILSRILRENLYRETIYMSTNYARGALCMRQINADHN